MENYSLVIKTLFGLEDLLAKEIQSIGGREIKIGTRMVQCEGDLGFVYKANFSLRTALKVLITIQTFRFHSQEDYYQKLLKIDWLKWFTTDQSFRVDIVGVSKRFESLQYAKLRAKDAIVDAIRNSKGIRPDVNKENPDFHFHVHLNDKTCTVSIDSSGVSLHKRGYKRRQHLAPISEVLAAGLLLSTGWDGKGNFLDPMCGSGTLAIEAAMIAGNIPPQVHRSSFAFENWPNYDPELWEFIQEKRLEKLKDFYGEILAFDIDQQSIEQTRINVKNADLTDFITIDQKDFFETEKLVAPLLIVSNPPYDERLPQEDVSFYNHIGDTLKKKYSNVTSWWISADERMWKNIGLRSSKKLAMMNGKLPCKFVQYSTYEGSKKASRQANYKKSDIS